METLLPEPELQRFSAGQHWALWRQLGANPHRQQGLDGVLFAVWAPNASELSVVGDFNGWDGSRHRLARRDPHGVWEGFVAGLPPGSHYQFKVTAGSGESVYKSDPYARALELRPSISAVTVAASDYRWQDRDWLQQRRKAEWPRAPMSIYELHLGSWRRRDGGYLSYRELAPALVKHVTDLGFTHVELLPISEHPFDGSWGYQPLGLYAPTARHGSGEDLRFLIDTLHREGIGVLLDWVPAHFPRDEHGLVRFDGSALYEHADPQRGEHPEWGTLIYDLSRPQVRNFLIANALYWLEEFHFDGLRVDAVASMLYLDYSREPGQWTPNRYGGRENLEAISFLRELNTVVHGEHPGAVVIAEESSTWPGVSRPAHLGGLGFSMKWSMGWMHDTLDYFHFDPVFRRYQHHRMTFGITYFDTENYLLPLSHDEVVHGKSPLLNKMPGDEWQRFANLRLLYVWMWTHPGKKLLFMGGEFAQTREWNHDAELDWPLLQYPLHRGVMQLVGDLNRLYRKTPALYLGDFLRSGFEWIDCHDIEQSVYSFQRRSGKELVIVVLNCTPLPRLHYRIGVPTAGRYRELLNSDARLYGGSDAGNGGEVASEQRPWMSHPCSLELTLPPLAGLVLQRITTESR